MNKGKTLLMDDEAIICLSNALGLRNLQKPVSTKGPIGQQSIRACSHINKMTILERRCK